MLRLALISDTHMAHAGVEVPACDLLIHAGDFTRRGSEHETRAFFAWLADQPASEKVVVAGNHDHYCEQSPDHVRTMARSAGATILFDEAIELMGLTIWGSPITPRFGSMAFNRDRGEEIRGHWDQIPDGLDVLITHGPPHGVLDRTFFGTRVGCADLTEAVARTAPRLHVFGHIHEAAGDLTRPGSRTRFINAATRKLVGGVRRPRLVHL